MPVPILRGAAVTLRSPQPADVEARLGLGQSAEIMRMFGVDPDAVPPLTRQDAAAFIERLDRHPWAWVIEHEGRFLGEVRLDHLDAHDRRASLAIGLYDEQRLGRGLGREAINLLLTHAFAELRLHRVGVRVVSYNERAIRAYKACSFVEEGREREAALVAGRWVDDIIMGLLASEFRSSGADANSRRHSL